MGGGWVGIAAGFPTASGHLSGARERDSKIDNSLGARPGCTVSIHSDTWASFLSILGVFVLFHI